MSRVPRLTEQMEEEFQRCHELCGPLYERKENGLISEEDFEKEFWILAHQASMDVRYSKMRGYILYETYAKREYGITDIELAYMSDWGYFYKTDNIHWPESQEYLDRMCRGIVEYRKLSIDDIREATRAGKTMVWEWPTAKRFYKIGKGQWHHNSYFSVGGPGDIVFCIYKDIKYYWGINKPEIKVTEDMVENGEWYVYTWAD